MNVHKNARLTPHGRERIVRQVESGQTLKAVGEAAGVCPRTVRKWVSRYRNEGLAGLRDRSSRPHRLHRPTPQAVVAEVARLRRQRYTGQQIAAGLRISPATVSRILRRLGLNRLAALEPAEPVRRYEREHPGELIHIDIKKLGRFNRVGHRITGDRRGQSNSRGVGWEYVHVCIDDASRIAYAEIKKSERKASAIAFLKAVVIYYAKLGISIQRVMTDNGSCYKSRLRPSLQAARSQAHPNQALYAENQWQGRALHPNCTPRMGLCQGLSALRSSWRRASALAAPLQLAPSPWQYRCQTAHQQTRSNREQPVEAPQLERNPFRLNREFAPSICSVA